MCVFMALGCSRPGIESGSMLSANVTNLCWAWKVWNLLCELWRRMKPSYTCLPWRKMCTPCHPVNAELPVYCSSVNLCVQTDKHLLLWPMSNQLVAKYSTPLMRFWTETKTVSITLYQRHMYMYENNSQSHYTYKKACCLQLHVNTQQELRFLAKSWPEASIWKVMVFESCYHICRLFEASVP